MNVTSHQAAAPRVQPMALLRVLVFASLLAGIDAMRSFAADLAPADAPRITLPEQVDITGLTLLTAETLSLGVEYDPAVFKSVPGAGTVTIRGVKALTPDELWALTNQVLAARGLALVRTPGAKVLSVVKLTDAAAMAGVGQAAGAPGEGETRGGFAHELVRARYRSAKDLAEAIKPFLTKGAGNASAVGDTGLIVISDVVPRIEEVKRLLDQLDVAREEIVPRVIETRNVPPAALASAVMQVAGKRDAMSGEKMKGEVSAAPDGRSVLLVAPVDTQDAWVKLIAALDQREEVLTREYTPRVFGAKEVANLVEQTVRDKGVGGSGSGSAGGANVAGEDRFRIVIDDLTGTLIVTATPSQHERIAALVERLDGTPQSAARPVRAFPIRNRPVKEVLATLQNLVSAGALESGGTIDASGMNSTGSAGLREAGLQRSVRPDAPSDGSVMPAVVPAPLAPPAVTVNRSSASNGFGLRGNGSRGPGISGLSLTADEGTNTLIAIAEPRLLAQLELLIRQLDVRQPQVMLEVFLVSLNEQDAMNLGVELEKLGSFSGNLYQLSSLFGLTSGSPGNRTPGGSQGFTGAILNPGDFSAVIKALETISSGATRSLPRVLVNNNQQATFNSVLQQPYTISNTTSGAGTTTSFGGTQDAGTTIGVRPQIAEADHLVLDYSLSLSSFVGAPPATGLPPPRQQNNVSSNATIPDGHTVVVGGIELVSDGKNTSQVPYIGDVPLVGELFKVRDNTKSRARFYVFIRATVLREQQLNDLKYLTDAAIRGNALGAVGVSDGFPTMRARVVK